MGNVDAELAFFFLKKKLQIQEGYLKSPER